MKFGFVGPTYTAQSPKFANEYCQNLYCENAETPSGGKGGSRQMLVKIPGKDTATVVAALSQHVRQLPAELRRSLTWDRGLEMARHQDFTVDTDVQVYFCDPQVPGSAARTKTPTCF